MKKFLSVILLVMFAVPAIASAQTTPSSSGPCVSGKTTNTTTNQTYASATSQQLGQCVSQIYLWSLGVAGVLALLMIVIGGYYVTTAAGNAAQAAKGKSYIFSSLIGLAILLGAYLLLSTINPDLVRFEVNIGN